MNNNYSNLSAESEISALATVSCEEVFTDENVAPVAPVAHTPRYGVNVDKLVLSNLSRPMHKRVAYTDLCARVAFARERGEIIALHAQIRANIANTLIAIRARQDAYGL